MINNVKKLNNNIWKNKVNTYEYQDDEYTRIKYHNTNVVSFNSREIILDTGGYFTKTTKERINMVSRIYSLGVLVFQRDFTWYVKHMNVTFVFKNNKITLSR